MGKVNTYRMENGSLCVKIARIRGRLPAGLKHPPFPVRVCFSLVDTTNTTNFSLCNMPKSIGRFAADSLSP